MQGISATCPVEHQFPIHVFSPDVIEGTLHHGNAEPRHPVQKPDTDPVAFGNPGGHRAFRLKCHTVFGISTIGFALPPWSGIAELISITALQDDEAPFAH